MVTLVGAVLTIVSIFLNWYSYDFFETAITIKPWEADTGKLLLVAGLLAAFFGYMAVQKAKKGMAVGALVMGIIVLLVVFANYPDDSIWAGTQIEMGYWLTLAGGLITVVGSVVEMKEIKK